MFDWSEGELSELHLLFDSVKFKFMEGKKTSICAIYLQVCTRQQQNLVVTSQVIQGVSGSYNIMDHIHSINN